MLPKKKVAIKRWMLKENSKILQIKVWSEYNAYSKYST